MNWKFREGYVMAPVDMDGTSIAAGDKVLVLQAPIVVAQLDDDAREAFSNAIGHAFIVQSVTPEGWLELELVPPRFRTYDTILLDATCARRVSTTFGHVPHRHRWGPGRPRFGLPANVIQLY